MERIPHEIDLAGVYVPPFLVAGILAFLATYATTKLLNRYRLSRFLHRPPIVFVALTAIYTVGFLTFLVHG